MARCDCDGSLPAFQAMTASTANSGSVCSQARIASASPCAMRNCAASAPQAITNAESRMLGKVHSADQADVFAAVAVPALMSFSIIGGAFYALADPVLTARQHSSVTQTISSRQNPLVKRIREAIREHGDEIAIEGPKPVADAIRNGWNALAIVVSAGSTFDAGGAVEVTELTRDVFDSVAETRQPQGVLGLFARPRIAASAILARRDTIAVALDGVQDPGNVGTIVRLAAAFDAAGVLLLPGCADAYGPKAIRSSAGAGV